MPRSTTRLLLAALAFAAALLAACESPRETPRERVFPSEPPTLREVIDERLIYRLDPVGTPPDDAGDHAFVRQAVPALLGRKVRGHDELKFFADLIRQTDRAQWLRFMLDRDSPYHREYVDHWSEVFVARLRVHRETERSLLRAAGSSCFVALRAGAPDTSLASCIARNAPSVDCAGGRPFSMGDVLSSAIAADKLEPLYRAYLFPLVAHPADGADATPLNRRVSVGETFNHVFVHRNLGCLGCHTTWSSVSGSDTHWNRHHPIGASFESAIYGNEGGRDVNEAFAVFRVDGVRGGASSPWGMSQCGSFRPPASIGDDSETKPDGGGAIEAFFGRGLGRRGTVWSAEETLRDGSRLLAAHGLRRTRLVADLGAACTDHCVSVTSPPAIPEPPTTIKTLIGSCTGCHGASHPTLNLSDDPVTSTLTEWLQRVVSEPSRSSRCVGRPYLVIPGNAADSCLNHLVQTNQMGAASATEKTALANWINGLPPGAGCDPGEPSICKPSDNDNPAAFAFLTAANIVDQVWDEVMGSRLTIANYYPRNPASREILENLTETVFVAGEWSLRDLLAKIVASEHFNRRAPQSSPLGSAYAQAPVAKPFEVNDPRYPPEALPGWTPGATPPDPDLLHQFNHLRNEDGRSRHVNGVGDSVFRYSAENLFSSTHKALGWPNAPRPAAGGAYPSDALRKSVGQFFQDAEPGFRGVGFQMLLGWEAQQGQCSNKNASAPDWIEQIVERVRTDTSVIYTNGDLAQTLRDWLLADATIGSTPPVGEPDSERALLTALYGDLAARALASTDAERDALRGKLRAHCGALLQSPQFLLAGIVPEGLGPKPVLRTCVDASLCSYQQICEGLRQSVVGNLELFTRRLVSRVDYVCSADTVSVSINTRQLPDDYWECPRGMCSFIPANFSTDPCVRFPEACLRPTPACRPGCARIDCCGGPGPPIDREAYSLLWAEGALIELARGARLYRDGAKGVPLEKGTRMQAGDWIELPPGARLRLTSPDGIVQTPKEGVPKGERGASVFMQITGPSAIAARDSGRITLPVTKGAIRRAIAPPQMPSKEWLEQQTRGEDRGAPRQSPR